jgi:hypothetical protein
MIEIWPHEQLRLDFDQMIAEAERQEGLSSVNRGEAKIARQIYDYFDTIVIPLIIRDEWIYNAAEQYATHLVFADFRAIRLPGKTTLEWQKRLHEIDEQVTDFLARMIVEGKALELGNEGLPKASDFMSVLQMERLDAEEQATAQALAKRAEDQEIMQLTVTLQGVRDRYEMGLPRVMFVVRRVMKRGLGISPSDSDKRLLKPSDYIDWFVKHADSSHPLWPIIGINEKREFYRAARNVAAHHEDLAWDGSHNVVGLKDRTRELQIPVHTFQQYYRHLLYLSEYGMRALLAAFCQVEQGPNAQWVFDEYEKTFPEGFMSEDLAIRKRYATG